MNNDTLTQILSKEQKAFGLYLEEDEDHLSLMKRGEVAPLCWFGIHAAIEAIQNEAQQQVEWAKSGIEFGRVSR